MTGEAREPSGPPRPLPCGRLPELLAVEIEGEEHQLAILVAGDVDLAAGHGHAGEACADVVGLPEQLRPFLRPLFEQAGVGRLAVVVGTAPLRPILAEQCRRTEKNRTTRHHTDRSHCLSHGNHHSVYEGLGTKDCCHCERHLAASQAEREKRPKQGANMANPTCRHPMSAARPGKCIWC